MPDLVQLSLVVKVVFIYPDTIAYIIECKRLDNGAVLYCLLLCLAVHWRTRNHCAPVNWGQ